MKTLFAIIGLLTMSYFMASGQISTETGKKPLTENLKSTAKGLQPFVDPIGDLKLRKDLDGNSWFVAFHGEGNGHKLNFMFHISVLSIPMGVRVKVVPTVLSITDETTGWYGSDGKFLLAWNNAKISNKELSIKTDNYIFEGNFDKLHLQASMPNGSVDVNMSAVGNVLYNGGAGLIRMFDINAFEYSVPEMLTEGTITIEGNTYNVKGISWFDRQYADFPKGKKLKDGFDVHWVWMDLNFDNNEDKISLWGMVDNKTGEEYAWATVLQPDGSHITTVVESLTKNASDYWKSPKSGQNYPLKWRVKIPDLNTDLVVTPTVKEQEIVAKEQAGSKYEGASTFAGTYKGKETTGFCYLELVGPWK